MRSAGAGWNRTYTRRKKSVESIADIIVTLAVSDSTLIFIALAHSEGKGKQLVNEIRQPATEKQSLFILDMEMLEDKTNSGRWVLTYALEGKPYVVVFRDNKAGQDFIQYLQESHVLWQKE